MAIPDDSLQNRFGTAAAYEPFPLHKWIWDHLGTSTAETAAQQQQPSAEIVSPTVEITPQSSVVTPEVSQSESDSAQGVPAALKELVAAIQAAVKELKQPEPSNANRPQTVAQIESTSPQAASPVVPETSQATVQAPVVAIDSSPVGPVSEPQDAGFENRGLLPAAFRPTPVLGEELPQNSTGTPQPSSLRQDNPSTPAYPTVEQPENPPAQQAIAPQQSPQFLQTATPQVSLPQPVADERPTVADAQPIRPATPQVERSEVSQPASRPQPESSLQGQSVRPTEGIDLTDLKRISESVDQESAAMVGDLKAMTSSVLAIGSTVQQAIGRMAGETATNRKALEGLQEQLNEQMVILKAMMGESEYGNLQYRAAGGAYG